MAQPDIKGNQIDESTLDLTGVSGSGLTGVLHDVVDDLTPQLGGDLDVNFFDISSLVNLQFVEGVGGSPYGSITLKAPDTVATSRTWVLPEDDPSSVAGYILTTDSSGVLSFTQVTPPLDVTTVSLSGSPLTYTLQLSDAGTNRMTNVSSPNIIEIPANASVAFPVGTEILLTQLGTGQLTVTIVSDTLNVNSTFTTSLAGQYSEATITKKTSTSWVISGDLEAA